MSSVLAVPIFVGSLVVADAVVVTAFGGQYAGGEPFLVGLALYRLPATQTTPRGAVVDGLDRPEVTFRISLAELVLDVALGLGLWYVYGPVGIVAATVVTQAFSYAAQTLAVRELTEVETVVTRSFLGRTHPRRHGSVEQLYRCSTGRVVPRWPPRRANMHG